MFARHLLLILLLVPALADAEWTLSRQDGAPPEIVPETRAAGSGLPDGLIATHDGRGDIAAAWYEEPTTRYAHGIMGDRVEAGTLAVRARDGAEHRLALPVSEVFEDRYPRLADLDGDGRVEIITIRSASHAGAALTIYGLEAGRLRERATTAFIGTPNRWLNIAGIAPFLGNDHLQIAYVTTPHIGGTLRLIGFEAGRLHSFGREYGFSNHWIGSRELRLSATMRHAGMRSGVDSGASGQNHADKLLLALPSAGRNELRIMAFAEEGPDQVASVPVPGRIDKAIGRTDNGFVIGLSNGEVYRVEFAP